MHVGKHGRASGRRRTVLLMVDYGAEYPIWLDGELDPEVLGISDDLRSALRDWQLMFDANYRAETGWTSVADKKRFVDMSDTLARRLRSELQGRYAVAVRIWTS